MKQFKIVVPMDDGGVEIYAMKQWLRDNPDQVPSGLDATSSTSHQLRNSLKSRGWSVQETPTEFRMLPPGTDVPGILQEEATPDDGDTPEASFGLEFQLRDFIAQNIGAFDVNGKRLRLFVDPTGRDGIEFPTAVGPIDILAIDELGNFFVFELKRARSPDRAIGQVTRYMGWVRQTIGKDRDVNGIIVAREISDGLRYAVSVVPKVSLFEYEVEFRLKRVQEFS